MHYIFCFYKPASLTYLDRLQLNFLFNHKTGYFIKGFIFIRILDMVLEVMFFYPSRVLSVPMSKHLFENRK